MPKPSPIEELAAKFDRIGRILKARMNADLHMPGDLKNQESFFVRHAYFLGANDPYGALKTTLQAEINPEA